MQAHHELEWQHRSRSMREFVGRVRARIDERRNQLLLTSAATEFENIDMDPVRKARILAMQWQIQARIAEAERLPVEAWRLGDEAETALAHSAGRHEDAESFFDAPFDCLHTTTDMSGRCLHCSLMP